MASECEEKLETISGYAYTSHAMLHAIREAVGRDSNIGKLVSRLMANEVLIMDLAGEHEMTLEELEVMNEFTEQMALFLQEEP